VPSLAACDLEPIHIPGAIQPHGVLLILDRAGLIVEQVAGDTAALLGVQPARALGLPLFALLDADVERFVERHLGTPGTIDWPIIALGVRARSGAAPLDLTFSADARVVMVELEPARRVQDAADAAIVQLKQLIAALYQARTLEESLAASATTLRACTGFDRAMVYRFLPDGTGVVAAEDVAPGVDSFLGLHYPASDIPAQARDLYKRNWLRGIPDVNYTPAPLVPPLNRRTGRPIDMSHCALRSVSPIHLEYLRNMGVGASFGLSVMCHGELWGMLMLHHRVPRHVAADLRVACETFAQIFSLQVETRMQAERSLRRLDARAIREQLLARLIATQDPIAALACPELLRYVGAAGAAVCFGAAVRTVGRAPEGTQLADLMAWLTALNRPLFACDHLVAAYPAAASWTVATGGLLAISLSREPRDFVVWIRPEMQETVRWAGEPAPVDTAAVDTAAAPPARLTPRSSFAEWREIKRGQGVPWSDVDRESAEALRVILLENVLESLNRTRLEREVAFQRQSLLLAELDHRVKNGLAKIQYLVQATGPGASSVQAFATALEQRIQAMAHAHSLLSERRWEGASLRRLIAEEIALLAADAPARVRLSGEDRLLTPFDALAMSLVLHELVTNAIKYGGLSVPSGTVSIDWSSDGEPAQLHVIWREQGGPPAVLPAVPGFGMTLIQRTVQYELQGSATVVIEGSGLRWDLVVPSARPTP
jgi:light-regulated signal transduction histidine kinase (bacteriophytochrome)